MQLGYLDLPTAFRYLLQVVRHTLYFVPDALRLLEFSLDSLLGVLSHPDLLSVLSSTNMIFHLLFQRPCWPAYHFRNLFQVSGGGGGGGGGLFFFIVVVLLVIDYKMI